MPVYGSALGANNERDKRDLPTLIAGHSGNSDDCSLYHGYSIAFDSDAITSADGIQRQWRTRQQDLARPGLAAERRQSGGKFVNSLEWIHCRRFVDSITDLHRYLEWLAGFGWLPVYRHHNPGL